MYVKTLLSFEYDKMRQEKKLETNSQYSTLLKNVFHQYLYIEQINDHVRNHQKVDIALNQSIL